MDMVRRLAILMGNRLRLHIAIVIPITLTRILSATWPLPLRMIAVIIHALLRNIGINILQYYWSRPQHLTLDPIT